MKVFMKLGKEPVATNDEVRARRWKEHGADMVAFDAEEFPCNDQRKSVRWTVVDYTGCAIGVCDGGGLDIVDCGGGFHKSTMTFETKLEATLLMDMLEAGGARSLCVERIEEELP